MYVAMFIFGALTAAVVMSTIYSRKVQSMPSAEELLEAQSECKKLVGAQNEWHRKFDEKTDELSRVKEEMYVMKRRAEYWQQQYTTLHFWPEKIRGREEKPGVDISENSGAGGSFVGVNARVETAMASPVKLQRS